MQKSTEPPPPQNATKNENVAACGGKQKTEIIELRDYQKDAIQQTRELLRNDIREILVQASTGAGKTIIGCEVMKSATEKGRRALFVAHRSEIVTQTSRKLDDFGISHGVIMANHKRINDEPVQVASIQTIIKRHYPEADIVIIDECHLSHGGSFRKLIKHYQENGAVIIGLTATPSRLDGKGLGDIYKSIVSVVSMRDLIKDGYLVETKVFAPYTPDLKGVGVRNGDYKAAELGEVVNRANIIGDIVENWQKYALDRKTICFATTVNHSKNIVAEFIEGGISAKHLDANSSKGERDQVLNDWRDGKLTVLSNVGLFVEGLDVPAASCCILARPTKSLTIYLQSVGRVMRPHETKTDCIILDHAGLTKSFGFASMPREWDLLSKKQRDTSKDTEVLSVTVCEACFCTYSRADNPDSCPNCGAEHPETAHKRRVIEDKARVLKELNEAEVEAEINRKAFWSRICKMVTLEPLLQVAKERGYKPQWAEHRLKANLEWRAAHGIR